MRIARAVAAVLVVVVTALAGCTVVVPGAARPTGASAEAPSAPGGAGTSSSPPTAPAPGLPAAAHVDEFERFAIVPPPGWTTDFSNSQAAVVFRAPVGDPSPSVPFTANIYVTVSPDGDDLATVVADAKAQLPQDLTDYRAVEDEPVVLAGGVPAHLLGGSFSLERPLRNLQLLAVHDGMTIIVTGTALASAWPDHAAALDRALRTLVVEV